MPVPVYYPPPLKTRVLLRYPSEKPEGAETRYGEYVETESEGILQWPGVTGQLVWPGNVLINWPGIGGFASWGVFVRAHRRDHQPDTVFEEGQVAYTRRTIWTIRHRADFEANAEIVFGEQVYRSVGPPVLRGGSGYGRRTKYLEVVTELVQ